MMRRNSYPLAAAQAAQKLLDKARDTLELLAAAQAAQK